MMEGGGATVRHRGRRFKRTSSGKQEGVGSQQTGNGMSTGESYKLTSFRLHPGIQSVII